MTEPEWLACTDPTPMLVFLRWAPAGSLPGVISDRKLLLFACACCSEIERAIDDERSKAALATARQFAEGDAALPELDAARAAAWEAVEALRGSPNRVAASAARAAAYTAAHPASRYAVDAAGNAAHAAPSAEVDALFAAYRASRDRPDTIAAAAEALGRAVRDLARSAKARQVALLRDIIGNPFRPVTIDPAWRTPSVFALARGIYEDQGFANLPALGAALRDVNCEDESILGHCESGAPHVRGCWVIDSILGRP